MKDVDGVLAVVPPSDGVWEALQRLIENGLMAGPASAEDARVVAKWRGQFVAAREAASGVRPVEVMSCPSCGAQSQCDAENVCVGEDCPLPDTGDDFEAALRQHGADLARAKNTVWDEKPCPRCDAPPGTEHSSSCPDGVPTGRRFTGVGELERTGYIPAGSADEREGRTPGVLGRDDQSLSRDTPMKE